MARKLSFAGIFSAVTILLVYFASIAPTGKLGLYAISSIPVALVLFEFGVGAGAAVYFVSAVLSFILAGLTGSFPYIIFFGPYSVLKYYIEKRNSAVVEILLKLLLFNAILYIAYVLLSAVQGMSIDLIGMHISIYILIAAAQIAFIIYDYVFSRLIYYYEDNIRKHIVKG